MYGFSLLLKILGAVIAVIVVIYLSYQNDIRAARERVMSGSQVIETKCGPIEYATMGEGPPVLVVHGSGGGFDQGLFIARELVEDGLRIIAPSRFGYLRTPLPADATPAAHPEETPSFISNVILKSDFALWLFIKITPSSTQALIRVHAKPSAHQSEAGGIYNRCG